MLRILTMAGGLLGAAGMSQFPEYSQQYIQRISGAVDELQVVVADFDASAADAGLNREEALAQMTGTPFLENRRQDITRSIGRLEWLQEAKLRLSLAGPMGRLMNAPKYADRDIGARALQDFKPAIPLSVEGAGFAAGGYVLGWGVFAGIFGLLGWLFRAAFRRGGAPA